MNRKFYKKNMKFLIFLDEYDLRSLPKTIISSIILILFFYLTLSFDRNK